ncbi:ATP-binding protein [Radiobacillus kanasensis]|uniref:ATP-binding protein n=1 Tax=Radiobacillus kanasensis TaxID=2844358 RepID=UPI001E60ECB8|nr:ATP-binding protein [Radiobacillus kanasensis]UFU00430.1 ATP-binding protein [Radiobacillus kanasensis]
MAETKGREIRVSQDSLSKGGHILYTYSDHEKYLRNAANFIEEGILLGHGIVFVEHKHNQEKIWHRLVENGITEQQLDTIIYKDIDEFYFDTADKTFHNFFEITRTSGNYHFVRTWGLVVPTIMGYEELCTYERESDNYVRDKHIISVCAYDATNLPTDVCVRLLESHDYYMTDNQIVPTQIYQTSNSVIPSIADQINLEKSAEEDLVRSEQLSFAGQLAAGICHEIRNPLTTIKGFFQFIKEMDRKEEKYFDVIHEELSRIEKITTELLLLAKPDSESRSKQNLVKLVEDVQVLLNTQAVLKEISIHTIFQEEELMIDCDPAKIKQVLINLIKNAIEVMDRGTITVTAKRTGNMALLTIVDEGPGMSQEHIQKIGEPFFTTKEKGTGLGLIICLNIIRNHNGKMKIESELGEGTTFKVSLPLV